MGALPAIGGVIVLAILFTILSPYFLTAGNFANLLNQAATLVMLGMALVFVLLLGEIDLSVGIVTTQLPQSSTSTTNFATELLARLSHYLSPEHPIEFPNAKFAHHA